MPEENPYKPPAAVVRDPPPAPRSPLVAILAGLGVDVGGTMLSSIVFGIVYSAMRAARGREPYQILEDLTAVSASSGFLVFGAIVGAVFSLLGGYACARLVRRDEHRFAAIVAISSMVIGLALGGASSGAGSNALNLVVTFAAIMGGAELGRRRNLADERKSAVAMAA